MPKYIFIIICTMLLLMGEGKSRRTVNRRKTSRNIFELSAITVLPVVTFTAAARNEDFKRELYFSASIFSIPALIGWPLFIRQARKNRIERRLQEREEAYETVPDSSPEADPDNDENAVAAEPPAEVDLRDQGTEQ